MEENLNNTEKKENKTAKFKRNLEISVAILTLVALSLGAYVNYLVIKKSK